MLARRQPVCFHPAPPRALRSPNILLHPIEGKSEWAKPIAGRIKRAVSFSLTAPCHGDLPPANFIGTTGRYSWPTGSTRV